MPRLAPNTLIFSMAGVGEAGVGEAGAADTGCHLTVGLLSPEVAKKLGSGLTVPQCSWSAEDRSILSTSSSEDDGPLPLNELERKRSLEVILEHSPFQSESELLAHFDLMKQDGKTGTQLVMWGAWEKEHDIKSTPGDILILDTEGAHPHERSMRSFLSLLYYSDNTVRSGDHNICRH